MMDPPAEKDDLTETERAWRKAFDEKLNAAAEKFCHRITHEMCVRFGELNAKLTSIDNQLKQQNEMLREALAGFAEYEAKSGTRRREFETRRGSSGDCNHGQAPG